jgi:hypothetical protein
MREILEEARVELGATLAACTTPEERAAVLDSTDELLRKLLALTAELRGLEPATPLLTRLRGGA